MDVNKSTLSSWFASDSSFRQHDFINADETGTCCRMFAKTTTTAHDSCFWAEKRIIAISFVITLSYFQYGYDSAAIAGFQSMRGFLEIYGHVDSHSPIGYNVSTEVQRLIQSLLNIGSFVSAVAIYFLGSMISRRLGLWIGCALAFLSVSIMIGVENLGGLYAGRLLLGMSNGFLVPYNVMFVSESVPSLLRGPILGMTILQTSLGALFGILVDNYTNVREGSASWRIPLGVMYIVPSLLTGFLFFLAGHAEVLCDERRGRICHQCHSTVKGH